MGRGVVRHTGRRCVRGQRLGGGWWMRKGRNSVLSKRGRSRFDSELVFLLGVEGLYRGC